MRQTVQNNIAGCLLLLTGLLTACNTPIEKANPSGSLVAQDARFEQILAANNRRTELFRYAPNLYVLDFIDLDTQADMLNRIAALVELADAPRDKILSKAEISELLAKAGRSWRTLYHGHDYRAADLARFFSLAQTQPSPLNEAESQLLSLLLELKFFKAEVRDSVKQYVALEPAKALISIPEDANTPAKPSELRAELFSHEVRHGLYFTDQAFRERCRELWLALPEPQREPIRTFLSQLGYDLNQENLVINEFQAYLRASDPTDLAGRLGLSEAELETIRQQLPSG